MLVMPAIDLRDGACVQLVGGSFADERVREPNPIAVAERWRDAGFTRLHVVDLDAATGAGSNVDVVSELIRVPGVTTQVGGGVRSTASAEHWLSAGATAVVVGTRALEDPAWVGLLSSRFPQKVIVALDVRDGRPVVRGWTTHTSSIEKCLATLRGLPLAGILVTCVDVEGRMLGPDLATIDAILAQTTIPMTASGGITTRDDLEALSRRGVRGAVVGMALYTGTLDPRTVAEEFGR